MAKLTVKDLNVRGKRVLVRVDYNVPMEEKDGQMVIVDDHLAVLFLHGYVVIHAHENAFAADIQVFDRQFSHKSDRGEKIPEQAGESKPNSAYPGHLFASNW